MDAHIFIPDEAPRQPDIEDVERAIEEAQRALVVVRQAEADPDRHLCPTCGATEREGCYCFLLNADGRS